MNWYQRNYAGVVGVETHCSTGQEVQLDLGAEWGNPAYQFNTGIQV